jgi:hypothetical protein
MAKYRLKDDLTNGVLPNGNPNVLFKKGDIIDGVIIERFIFNTNTKGIESKPTVLGARVETSDGLAFVPIWAIDLVNQPIDVKPTSEAVKQQNLLGGGRTLTTEDKFYEMLGIKKTDGTGWGLQSRPVGRLLVAVVLIGGYFAYKKFKK